MSNQTSVVALVLGLAIGVIAVTSLLAPITADAIEGNSTVYENSGHATYKVDGSDNYSVVSAPNYVDFQINGEPYNVDGVGVLMITDKMRWAMAGHYSTVYDETGIRISNINTQNAKVTGEYNAESKTVTINVYADYVSTEPTQSVTYTVENIVYFLPTGNYTMIATNGDPSVTYYVKSLSEVIAGGAYTTGNLDTAYFAEGQTIYVGNSAYTGTVTATTETVNGVIEGSNFTITISDGTNTETFTPFNLFVPLKVLGETETQHLNNALIAVIPILAFIALIAFAAFAVRGRMND